MDGVKDVAPEIIEAILKDFEESMSSPTIVIQQLEEQAKQIGANYGLAYRYAGEVNNALNKAIRDNLTADVLPDGNLYYNIAERVFGVTLKRGHDFVTDFAKIVQNSINKENGVGLKPVSSPFNEDRAKGIAKYVAYNRLDPTPYDEVIQKKISDAVENYLFNSVDETIRENAELHSKVGLHAVIKRIVSSSKPCERCQNLQGTYDYEDVRGSGNPVFQRHTRCHCIVLYKSSKDTDWLDVHSKYDSYSDEEVKRIEKETNIKLLNHPASGDNIGVLLKKPMFENVFLEYYRNATPNKGLLEYDLGFKPQDNKKEVHVANIIHKQLGGNILFITKSDKKGVRKPDYLWNKRFWELKTSTGSKSSIDGRIRDARDQIKEMPGGIIIDLEKNIYSQSKIESIIFDRLERSYNFDVDIIIISNNKIQKILRYKKKRI